MFLKATKRKKDGKVHTYWSVVESRRVMGQKTPIQKHLLYLGELDEKQIRQWQNEMSVFNRDGGKPDADLFEPPWDDSMNLAKIIVPKISLHRPRQWGACWLFCQLYEELGLAEFFRQKIPSSRKKTAWTKILEVLTAYRFISPGSEWRLHREWFDKSAMGDLLGGDFSLAEPHKLYRCHDGLTEHKAALFLHLKRKWEDLFGAKFDVLLYDLTSTYFESSPPENPEDKRRFGYSRDKRSDCVQVVIALIVTPDGLPLAYEVMPGNTSDKTTLRDFLKKIETQYGKSERTWIMDRGIPTEEVLSEMRSANIHYLVGTPKGRLTKLSAALSEKPWSSAREGVSVKLLQQENEVYIFAQSRDRVFKERAMRLRQLKALCHRLKELQNQKQPLSRDKLLMELGAAKSKWPQSWRLMEITLPETSQPAETHLFSFRLNWQKLRIARLREGSYLLRSNLTDTSPEQLWQLYMRLCNIEEAFRNLKGDLSLRPIYHQREDRIEAHIFISFLAYCIHITIRNKLRFHAAGLTPRTLIEKFSSIQMIDVHLPTCEQHTIILSRYTQPDNDLQLLLNKLKLSLPQQPPPKIAISQS